MASSNGAFVAAPSERPWKLGQRPALDGMRALAITAVLLVHVSTILVPSLAGRIASGGVVGVDAFFVLSGFLITSLLIEEHDRSGSISLRSFYRRRVLRLWPALYLLLIGQFVYSLVAHNPTGYTLRGDALIAGYQSNWAWAFGWPVPTGLDNTWSLAVEEQFYLIWPLLLLALLRLRDEAVPLAAVAIAVFSACWRAHLYATTGNWVSSLVDTPAHLDGLMLGAFIAWCYHRGHMPPRLLLTVLVLPAAACFAWLTQTAGPQIGLYDGGFPLADVCSAMLLMTALEPGWTQRLLAVSPLRWLGRLSYSLYLWHPLVFGIIYLTWPSSNPWLRLCAGLAASFALACSSYYLVERPFVAFAHRQPAHRRPVHATTRPCHGPKSSAELCTGRRSS